MLKNVLKFAVFVLCLAGVISVSVPKVIAQEGMSGGMAGSNPEVMQKLEAMSAQLKLTPAQKKQVLPILMQEAPKMKDLKANTSLGPMQKAMQMRQIAEDTDSKMKPILTPSQYQTWQQMRAQEREQMMQKMENK